MTFSNFTLNFLAPLTKKTVKSNFQVIEKHSLERWKQMIYLLLNI